MPAAEAAEDRTQTLGGEERRCDGRHAVDDGGHRFLEQRARLAACLALGLALPLALGSALSTAPFGCSQGYGRMIEAQAAVKPMTSH